MVDGDTKFLQKIEVYNLKPILMTITKLEQGMKIEEGKLKIDMNKKKEKC